MSELKDLQDFKEDATKDILHLRDRIDAISKDYQQKNCDIFQELHSLSRKLDILKSQIGFINHHERKE